MVEVRNHDVFSTLLPWSVERAFESLFDAKWTEDERLEEGIKIR